MKKLNKITKFGKFCASIGNLPTSYVESMTYQEQLLWLCNYIENTIFPLATKNEIDITTLQNLYQELKDYVDNYFDNLDVQEEINTKLDEMASSGELINIISEYLTLNTIIGYDNVNLMKAENNFIEGIIVKTLGKTSYNDGEGAFYKIRTLTSGDIIDEDNIVSLTNYDTLIAEKIFNKDIIDIQNDITDIEDDINDIEDDITTRLKIYNITTSNTFDEIQTMMNDNNPKILNFATGNYTFTDTFTLNSNTKLLFNNSLITFNIPKVTEDSSKSHGFFNFLPDDEFTSYNGNGNIEFIGGILIHGNISFCHARNIKIINMGFQECWNDHILEMCGINGLYVENCVFNGNIVTNIRKEYIQVDNCLYSSFPWFNDSSNISYDGTINKNWQIINNEFYVPNNSLGGVCFIGNHVSDSTLCHNNIIIKNNIFNGTKNMCIHLQNVKNIIIEDNEFLTNNIQAINNEGSMIRFRNICENIKILNNTFNGNYRAIEYASPQTSSNNWLISNNKFENYNSTENNQAIIQLTDIINISINNNIFENFSLTCIKNSDSTGTITSNKCYICNNEFNTNNTITNSVIRAYNGYSTISSNTFNIPNYNDEKIIVLGSESNTAFITKNSFSNEIITGRDEVSVGGYTKTLKNICNVPFMAWNTNTSDVTNQNPDYPFEEFTNCQLTIGSGANTLITELEAWTTLPYLTERTYKIPYVDGTDVTYIVFKINADGTFDYDSNNTGINLRYIKLYNNIV